MVSAFLGRKIICKYLILFCLQSSTQTALSQKLDTVRVDTLLNIAVSAKFAVIDHLKQCYIITQKNELEKYGTDGRLLARYSNNRLGEPAYADVSNPQKIILFYKNFRTLVLLDRNLTELGSLSFETLGYPFVDLIASARDGNLWIYDEINFKLIKISPYGNLLFESQALNFLPTFPNVPIVLQETEQSVWLLDSSGHVFEFNLFGQFTRHSQLPNGVKHVHFSERRAFYLFENQIFSFDLNTGDTQIIFLENTADGKFSSPNNVVSTREDSVLVLAFTNF